MQNREFTTHFVVHWCFNYFSQIPNWVRLKFCQQVNRDIIFLHKKFQRNPLRRFGFMIKSVTIAATRNFVAHSIAYVCVDHFAAPGTTKCPVVVRFVQFEPKIPQNFHMILSIKLQKSKDELTHNNYM
jgi:hypothetical protein